MHYPSSATTDGDHVIRSLIVFDFDGTLCLGDAPALAYARAVEEVGGVAGVLDTLLGFLENPALDERYGACDDPYDVVNLAARAAGVDEAQRSTAYLKSRAEVADFAVHTPDGLHEFLDGLHSQLVLVTNAPGDGLEVLLERLGLSSRFHDIVSGADKPAGMTRYVAPHLARGRAVLSVGDKWINDLAPVAELGGSTALIDTYGAAASSPADHIARTLPELFPALRAWDSRHHETRRTAAV